MGRKALNGSIDIKGGSVSTPSQVKDLSMTSESVSVKQTLFYFSLDSVSSMFFYSIGDLTIHNLNRKDAMDYSVDFDNVQGQNIVNKVKLTVTGKSHSRSRPTQIEFVIVSCIVFLFLLKSRPLIPHGPHGLLYKKQLCNFIQCYGS